MNSLRTVLNEIKKIRGIENDMELAKQVGVPVHTLRSWIQNESIRRQLIVYCATHDISLHEVLFSKKKFHKNHCENCQQKESCNEYRNVVDGPLTIGEGRLDPRTVIFDTRYSEQVEIELQGNHRIKSNFMLDLKEVDHIVIKLQSVVSDEAGLI